MTALTQVKKLIEQTHSNGVAGDAVLLTVLNGLLEIWTVM